MDWTCGEKCPLWHKCQDTMLPGDACDCPTTRMEQLVRMFETEAYRWLALAGLYRETIAARAAEVDKP